ncbi:Queuine tRNA-ribosyltransferase-like protein [Madurella mycetomatis]|uniref:Queuine tRNA-ribosyltransferase-like protein n=1 Tax=Madurella mycetomatis TaxID=100816 RepID=A0A175WJJ5_9PEZI|nr:Queuine tRNA-ribosyltransferase-like protein [Madurella mycetomatis]
MTVDKQHIESGAMRFELLGAALKDGATARLGRLVFAGRRAIDTPNYIGITSRGALPHLTPDSVSKHLQVSGAYMALEDFIEKPQQCSKRVPPIYSAPTTTKHPTPLHNFTAMPSSVTTVLSARRLPAVPSPAGNTNNAISIFTSTGFQPLPTKEYLSAIQTLKPDIAIPPADLTHSAITPNSKRALRMAERTDEWVVEWFSGLPPNTTSTFAPVLPIAYSIQWEYLSRLAEDYLVSGQLSGLAVYDADVVTDLESFCPALLPLPRLSLAAPQTPHHILRQIALGMDVFTVPFVNAVSDAGLALDFRFPPPSPPLPAPPMLGWTLLQVHNHAVVSEFFAAVRAALSQGEGCFEEGRAQFALAYEPEFREGLGERPRARGYQYKSVGGGEGKRNKPAWGKLGGEGDSGKETPVVPVEGGKELEGRGFAEIRN